MRKKPEPDHGHICFDCADSKKWVWPEGHVGTVSYDTCPYCKRENVGTAGTNDFIKPGEKSLKNWD